MSVEDECLAEASQNSSDSVQPTPPMSSTLREPRVVDTWPKCDILHKELQASIDEASDVVDQAYQSMDSM